jgi:hypothetical protein
MKPLLFRLRLVPLALASALALLAGGACAQSVAPRSAVPAPPAEAGEKTVRSADGRATATLLVSSDQIQPGERVQVQVANRGLVAINYGRPVTVERWTGSAWEETAESRDTAWTMELLQVEPGRSGVEQPWPFQPGRRMTPGWYRFSKVLFFDSGGQASGQLVVRARVEVVAP